MPSLNDHGKLAAVIIPFYVPILLISFMLVLRHGFRRESGWIFLFIFSIIRILGAALQIASQLVRPININLYIAAAILNAAGLSPLLLGTLGFVQTVAKKAFGENPVLTRGYRLLGAIGIVGFILSIVGGINASSTSQSQLNQSKTFRHVGSILFIVLYGLLIAVHIGCWLRASELTRARRTLLIAISSALPFLGIRVIYSVLSAYSGSLIPDAASSTTSSLSKFNITNGEWQIYLGMGLIMEYIVVLVYTVAGTKIPLHNDDDDFSPQKETTPPQAAYPGQGYSAPSWTGRAAV